MTQTTSHAAFEDIGVGARAPGMGNAFSAIADDVYAIYYNPAGLALLNRPELATSYSRLFTGLSDSSELSHSFVAYAHPLNEGKRGTAGMSWQRLSLSGLYQEQAIAFSYSNKLSQDLGPGDLYGGLNLKYLNRSFGSFPEAVNSCDGIACGSGADPVLSGASSKGAPDADFGLLYRLKEHFSVGLAVLHLTEPNVAFSSGETDTAPRSVKLGLNYRSLLSNLAVQLDNSRSSVGTQDQKITVGAERWFPRLFVGDFGVRGALGVGSRDAKNFSLGASYRTGRMSVDYGFTLPINAVASIAGSHRLGFSIRFGAMREADESVELILEAMRKLKSGIVPDLRAFGRGLSPAQKLVLEEHLAHVKSAQIQAKYKEALDALNQALTVAPGDTDLLKSFGRLNFIAQSLKELPDFKTDPLEAAWHQGLLAYLSGNDAMAVEKVSYALSLNPEHKGLDGFLAQMELATGLKRLEYPKPVPANYELQQKLTLAATALEDGRYQEVIDLSLEVLKQEPDNLAAWENLGTSYFALEDYPQALTAWEKAYALDSSPARRSVLKGYLKSIKNVSERPPKAAVKPAVVSAPRAKASPQEVQKIYNIGVDAYASGRLEEAKRAFEQVLKLEPGFVPAAKALIRVKEEMPAK